MKDINFSPVQTSYPHALPAELQAKIPVFRVVTNREHFDAQLAGMEELIDPSEVQERVRICLTHACDPALPRPPCPKNVFENNGLVIVGRAIPTQSLQDFPGALPALLHYTGAYSYPRAATHVQYARAGVLTSDNDQSSRFMLTVSDLPQELARKDIMSREDLLREQKKRITVPADAAAEVDRFLQLRQASRADLEQLLRFL